MPPKGVCADTYVRREQRQKKADDMFALYCSGQSYEEIGRQYSLTRERIRQLMALCGYTKEMRRAEATKRRKKVHDAKIAKAVALYKEGYQRSEAISMAHLGHWTKDIDGALRNAGCTRSARWRRLEPVDISKYRKVFERFSRGERAADIAKSLKLTKGTIYHRLRFFGYHGRRSVLDPKSESVVAVMKLHEEGKSSVEIRQQTGLTIAQVIYRLRLAYRPSNMGDLFYAQTLK